MKSENLKYSILNVHDYPSGLEKAIHYIHSKWGNSGNYLFYQDAISHSSMESENKLPKFYLMVKENRIVGCYGLIINDLISRHYLFPWFACLFIEAEERGKQLCRDLFEHAKIEVSKMGYDKMFLTTDHDGLYEKFGWKRIEDGYNIFGECGRIYEISVMPDRLSARCARDGR